MPTDIFFPSYERALSEPNAGDVPADNTLTSAFSGILAGANSVAKAYEDLQITRNFAGAAADNLDKLGRAEEADFVRKGGQTAFANPFNPEANSEFRKQVFGLFNDTITAQRTQTAQTLRAREAAQQRDKLARDKQEFTKAQSEERYRIQEERDIKILDGRRKLLEYEKQLNSGDIAEKEKIQIAREKRALQDDLTLIEARAKADNSSSSSSKTQALENKFGFSASPTLRNEITAFASKAPDYLVGVSDSALDALKNFNPAMADKIQQFKSLNIDIKKIPDSGFQADKDKADAIRVDRNRVSKELQVALEEMGNAYKDELKSLGDPQAANFPPGTKASSILYSQQLNGADPVDRARAVIGKEYKAGQSARCSDFVCAVFDNSNVGKPSGVNDTAASWNRDSVGHKVSNKSRLIRGDVVIFENTYNGPNRETHVGIATGNGTFIHRPTKSKPVREDSINSGTFANKFLVGRRLESDGTTPLADNISATPSIDRFFS